MNGLVLENQFTIFININTKIIRPFSRIYELKSTLNPFKSYEIYALDVILMSREKGSTPFEYSRTSICGIPWVQGLQPLTQKDVPVMKPPLSETV